MDRKPFRTTRRITNLRQGRNDWYKITNSTAAGVPSQVRIYDEIGYFGVTAQDFLDDLATVDGPIDLHLNTPGGEVFDGIAIYSAIKQRGGVNVIVDSLAASIGSVIAMGGETVAMSPGSQLMIHDGFGMGIGNAADMRELADLLDRQSDNIAGIYAERTGKPQAYWRDLMRGEQWFSAQEAVDAGLADKVLGKEPAAADLSASWDLSVFAEAPRTTAINETDAKATLQVATKQTDPADGTGNQASADIWAEFTPDMFRLVSDSGKE